MYTRGVQRVLPEEVRLFTKGRQDVYWRETGCLQEGGRGSLPKGDRVYIYSQTAPWMTPLIRELMIKRDAAKKEPERSPAVWNSYKKLRNQVTRVSSKQ